MYVLVSFYRKHDKNEIKANLVGIYETFDEYDDAIAHEVESRRKTDGFEWALYPNRGWVMNESADTWEWLSFSTDADGDLPLTIEL